MAASDTSRPAPFGAITTYGFVQFFANTRERLQRWNDTRRTRNALRVLSDRELADIGLTRADVERVATGPTL